MRDLHLDPDGLRAVATDLSRVVDLLELAPPDPGAEAVLAGLPDGARLAAEHERLMLTVARATAELADLTTTMRHTAGAVECADLDIACGLRRVGGQL